MIAKCAECGDVVGEYCEYCYGKLKDALAAKEKDIKTLLAENDNKTAMMRELVAAGEAMKPFIDEDWPEGVPREKVCVSDEYAAAIIRWRAAIEKAKK